MPHLLSIWRLGVESTYAAYASARSHGIFRRRPRSLTALPIVFSVTCSSISMDPPPMGLGSEIGEWRSLDLPISSIEVLVSYALKCSIVTLYFKRKLKYEHSYLSMNVGLGNNCGTLNYLLHTDVFNKLNVSISESYIPTLIDNIENSHVFLTSSQQQMHVAFDANVIHPIQLSELGVETGAHCIRLRPDPLPPHPQLFPSGMFWRWVLSTVQNTV